MIRGGLAIVGAVILAGCSNSPRSPIYEAFGIPIDRPEEMTALD